MADSELSGSVQYREMVDITSKGKGLRKPRKLKLVRKIPTFQEVDLQARGGAGRTSGVTEVVNMTSTRLMATSREVTKLRGSIEEDKEDTGIRTAMSTTANLIDLSPLHSQWKESEYSVYLYSPNQQAADNQSSDTRSPDSGFSLTMVGSSISKDKEHLVREHVATRLSQGTLYHSSGQVTTLDPEIFPPPSQSYYCLLKVGSQGGEEGGLRQYLVCFLSIGKEGLDLFRTDLDAYCLKLLPLLKELPDEDAYSVFPESKLQLQLDTWFSDNVTYLVRVVQQCRDQLPALLHTAVNSQVAVTGDDPLTVRDVKQFLNACSLANLMQLSPTEATPTTESEFTRNITIDISKKGCTLSSEESSKFCQNWAQVLLSQGTTSPDPFFLRQAVENYKLKIIQDINALKRLLRAAEMDYHALYRCYMFLCSCGNGRLLLECAMQEAQALPSAETLAVLKALQIYSQKSGFGD